MFLLSARTELLGSSEKIRVEITPNDIVFDGTQNLLAGALVSKLAGKGTVKDNIVTDLTFRGEFTSGIDEFVTDNVLPALGIPEPMVKILEGITQVHIQKVAYGGELGGIITGNSPLTVYLDAVFFGDEEWAKTHRTVTAVLPKLDIANPAQSLLAGPEVIAALSKAMVEYLLDNPKQLPEVDLAVVKLTKAYLGGLTADSSFDKYKELTNRPDLTEEKWREIKPKQTVFVINGSAMLLGEARDSVLEVSSEELRFYANADLADGQMTAEFFGNSKIVDGKFEDMTFTADFEAGKLAETVEKVILPALGLPAPVIEGMKEHTPVLITGATASGKFDDLAKAQLPMTVSLDTIFFGYDNEKETVKANLTYDALNPIVTLLTGAEVPRAFTRAFLKHLIKHPRAIPDFDLGVIALTGALAGGLPPDLTFEEYKTKMNMAYLEKPKWEKIKPTEEVFLIKAKTNLFDSERNISMEVSETDIRFSTREDLAAGLLVTDFTMKSAVKGDKLDAMVFDAEVASNLDSIVTEHVMPALGIPETVTKTLKDLTPLVLRKVAFSGDLVGLMEGNSPVTVYLDPLFFGDEEWAKTHPTVTVTLDTLDIRNPLKPLLTGPRIVAGLSKAMVEYLIDNPKDLTTTGVPLDFGVVQVSKAYLGGLTADTSFEKYKELTNRPGLTEEKWQTIKPTGTVFVVNGSAMVLGEERAAVLEVSSEELRFYANADLADGQMTAEFFGNSKIVDGKFEDMNFTADFEAAKLAATVETEILPALGLPAPVIEVMKENTPVLITGATASGKFDDLALGQLPLTVSLDTVFFGHEEDKETVTASLTYDALNPIVTLLTGAEVPRAFTRAFLKHLIKHPRAIPDFDLGVIALTGALAGGLPPDLTFEEYKTKMNMAYLEEAKWQKVKPTEEVFLIKATTTFLGLERNISMEVSETDIRFSLRENLAGGLLVTDFTMKSAVKDGQLDKMVFDAEVSSNIDDVVKKEILPGMGIPDQIINIGNRATPMRLEKIAFSGDFVALVKGDSPVTVYLDTVFFDDEPDRRTVTVKLDNFDVANPLQSLLGGPKVVGGLTVAMVEYLLEEGNTQTLPALDLGILKLDASTLGGVEVVGFYDPESEKANKVFQIKGGLSSFLSSPKADMRFGQGSLVLNFEDKLLGGIIQSKYTMSGRMQDLNLNMHGSVTADLGKWLKADGLDSVAKEFEKLNSGFTKARKDLGGALAEVEKLDKDIAQMRVTVKKERENAVAPVKVAEA